MAIIAYYIFIFIYLCVQLNYFVFKQFLVIALCFNEFFFENTTPGLVYMVVEISIEESEGIDFPLSPSWQVWVSF